MIQNLIDGLSSVEGVIGIVYGGSRGLGINNPDSDYDIVLYYDALKPLPHDRIAKNIPRNIDFKVTQPLIFGTVESVKFEIFQKNINLIEKEVRNNLQGKFQWKLAQLFPYGDLSYRQVSHLANYKVLWDPNKRLKKTIDIITPIPILFKNSVINHFFKQMNINLIHLRKVKKEIDQFHFISLVGLILFCYVNVLFVVNNRYPIVEKGNIQIASTLPLVPKKFVDRINKIYRDSGNLHYGAAYESISSLLAELRQLIHEDKKKQGE